MPYHGEVSKYRIPTSHAASRAARAASSLTTTDKLPMGAQPKPTLVIGSSCCPMLTRCVKSNGLPFVVNEMPLLARRLRHDSSVQWPRYLSAEERGGEPEFTYV